LKIIILLVTFLSFAQPLVSQELFHYQPDKETRWVSFENISGEKGAGGKENKGAKGHAFDQIPAGGSVDLVDMEGSGTIRRIWLTLSDRSPEMLRSLRLEMYWEESPDPAVSAPLGDFFGVGLGRRVPFESALFSDPEGRSFNCIVPMPFKKHARIVVHNDAASPVVIFYDVDILLEDHGRDMLWFHAYWSRDQQTTLEEDFEILPLVEGSGRFLGTNIGIQADPVYGNSWWGEGEVKIYLDGDGAHATLVGTGTEDYVGTAYGQGTFDHLYQGSPVIDQEAGLFAFYRYHIPDPVFFHEDIRVTIQQIGGAMKDQVAKMLEDGAVLRPVSIHNDEGFQGLMDLKEPVNLRDPEQTNGWTNFYRQDDVSATAYFYLDRPQNNLPAPGDLRTRVNGLR